MPIEASSSVDGIGQAQMALRTVGASLDEKMLVRNLRKGVKIVLARAQEKAPLGRTKSFSRLRLGRRPTRHQKHQSGSLRQSLKVKRGQGNLTTAEVILFANKKTAFYAHMVEFGHEVVKTVGRGRKRVSLGNYPAKGFMLGAWEETKDEALLAFQQGLGKDVRRIIRRASRGAR